MKSILNAIVLSIALLWSADSSATFYDPGAQVNQVYQTDGITLIKLDGTMDNPSSCVSDFWYAIPSHLPMHDDYVRMALTALASGKVLSVYLDSTRCWGTAPLVVGLVVNR